MIWDSNDEIGAMQEKYSLIFLNIDCDRKLSENKKLPTNAWIVTYLDTVSYTHLTLPTRS